jgi:endonuclease III
MMKKSDIHFVFEELTKRYAGSTTELIYDTPFQLLVSVIMSAQTTDKQVNKVTAFFFDTIKWPKDILKLKPEKWESMIAWVNYYKNKAKNIYKMAGILVASSWGMAEGSHKMTSIPWDSSLRSEWQLEWSNYKNTPIKKWGYRIPDTQEELVKLPWVWEKTAKVILQVLYWHDVIAVDTHVHRVTNRLWIVKTNEPLQTSKILEAKVPPEFRWDAHHGLILFGRYHCTARNPKCDTCPFTKICAWYKKNKK